VNNSLTAKQAEKYLLSKPETVLSFPFGDGVKVFKVKNKMFATISLGAESVFEGASKNYWMNLKCDPDEAAMLRDIFASVIPGYHMNKMLAHTKNKYLIDIIDISFVLFKFHVLFSIK
jgi:predicted DNA-binding protein (MmcQ/YjbR family)